MKHRVITQAADLTVILRYLSGEYRISLASRVAYWIGVALFLAIGVWITIGLFPWSARSGDDFTVLVVGIASMLGTATGLLNQALTSYRFSETHIERRAFLPFLRRRLAAANIHEGYVVMTEHGYFLELVPVEGRGLTIPLDGKLRKDLAKLYTEIGPDPLNEPIIDARFRPLIYGITGLVVIAAILVAIVLTRRGLMAW